MRQGWAEGASPMLEKVTIVAPTKEQRALDRPSARPLHPLRRLPALLRSFYKLGETAEVRDKS